MVVSFDLCHRTLLGHYVRPSLSSWHKASLGTLTKDRSSSFHRCMRLMCVFEEGISKFICASEAGTFRSEIRCAATDHFQHWKTAQFSRDEFDGTRWTCIGKARYETVSWHQYLRQNLDACHANPVSETPLLIFRAWRDHCMAYVNGLSGANLQLGAE